MLPSELKLLQPSYFHREFKNDVIDQGARRKNFKSSKIGAKDVEKSYDPESSNHSRRGS